MGIARVIVALVLSCGVVSSSALAGEVKAAVAGDPIQPLLRPVGLDLRKVALGRRLFFDPILSADGTISCASCHDLDHGGADHRRHAVGINGAEGAIRVPTVFNSSLNFVQFWDGRAVSLEAQVAGPVTNPLEMGATWPDVLAKLARQPDYDQAFRELYGHAPTAQAVSEVIATFERTLVTVNSRFDAYLAGDQKALSEEERKGYGLFRSYGCASCHQGANVGGNMFEKFGFLGDYLADRGDVRPADLGRYNVTHREADRGVFKVPSLRLSAVGGPYFHDGSVNDLPTAIQLMGRYQLGRSIPEKDIQLMIQFLGSLVGDQRVSGQ